VRNLGIFLMIVGVVWGVIAFNMKTSIETDGRFGTGLYSFYIPSEVHNLDLADRRRNHLIGAGITILSGILLFGFGSMQPTKETSQRLTVSNKRESPVDTQGTDRKCPFCAETIKQEAVVCRYCNRDIPKIEVDMQKYISDAEIYLESLKDADKATYEKFAQMSEKERKSSCFACHGKGSYCGMCDFRESNLKKYLEAKQAVEMKRE
jgi:hypothetical protein